MTPTDPSARRVERAALAGVQTTTLYLKYDRDEAGPFIKLMTGDPRPDTYSRPRHVKQWPTGNGQVG